MAKHGQGVRGFSNVTGSSISGGRFGRMFRNLAPAHLTENLHHVENALLELGMTMIQQEFESKIAAHSTAVPIVDVALNEDEFEDENRSGLTKSKGGPAAPPNELKVPAGYTYLGQFIDHDITFDPTSSLDRFNDPDALHDFRTPRLDLDSIYGSGPDDQPFLYDDDGFHFLLGENIDYDPARNDRFDLPRNSPTKAGSPRRALTGDKRNDENKIVSQLHATFLRFHNKVLDKIVRDRGTSKPDEFDFQEAQRMVRWHYQWIVLHDYLPRIVGKKIYGDVVLGHGGGPDIRFFKAKTGEAFMPVEFAGAAFRFGHSMVRPSYSLNLIVTSPTPKQQNYQEMGKTTLTLIEFERVPIFSLTAVPSATANMNGFGEVPGFWAIDWGFFFEVDPDTIGGTKSASGLVLPQPSYKIDTILVDPLRSLPDHQSQPASRRSLANLNLLRGYRLQLPSGQAIAHRMGLSKGDILSDDILFDLKPSAKPDERAQKRKKLYQDSKSLFKNNAPLWYYILKEAEHFHDGQHLGPVGGRIVAEVLTGMVTYDRHSYLSSWPNWTPELAAEGTAGQFTMADLIRFTNQ